MNGPEPRLPASRGARDDRLRRGASTCCCSRSSGPTACAWATCFGAGIIGIADVVRVRLDHAVLHRVQVPPGARDRRGLAARARRPTSSRGIAVGLECTGAARDRDLGRAPRRRTSSASWRCPIAGARPLRHRRRDDGHARHRRLHPGDGHLRPDHRQRRRHRRDVEAARGDPPARPTGSTPSATRRRRSPRATRSARPRSRRSCSSRPTSTRSRRSPGERIARRPDAQARGVRRRPARRDAGVLLLARSPSRPSARPRRSSSARCARQFTREPGHHAGHREARLRALRRHRHARRAARRWSLPGLLAVLHADRGRASSSSTSSPYGQIGAEAVAALLMVGTIAGILMATFLNNGGGAWDNAKKYIESGEFRWTAGGRQALRAAQGRGRGRHGRRPFKDTAGPSLHVLIKLLSTITLVLAPLFIV